MEGPVQGQEQPEDQPHHGHRIDGDHRFFYYLSHNCLLREDTKLLYPSVGRVSMGFRFTLPVLGRGMPLQKRKGTVDRMVDRGWKTYYYI